jgi:hypothetical protein
MFGLTILLRLSNRNQIFLYNTNFDSYIDYYLIILITLFIGLLPILFYSLGKYISNKFGLGIGFSLNTGIGLVVFNILLLPLFIIKLLYYPIIIIIIFSITLLTYKEVNTVCVSIFNKVKKQVDEFAVLLKNVPISLRNHKNNKQIEINENFQESLSVKKFFTSLKRCFTTKIDASQQFIILRHFLSAILITLIILAFIVHFLYAISPVNFAESLGDIANSYLDVYMNLAYYHGLKFLPNHAGSLVKFLNFDVLESTLIVLSHPQSAKVFGFLIFVLLSLMVFSLFKSIFENLNINKNISNKEWSYFALLLFLLCPVFLDEIKFSYAHDRNYFIFLSFLTFYILFLGIQQKDPKYIYLNLPIMGILFGSSLAGPISVAINFILILFFIRDWKKNYKLFSVSFAIFVCISSIFPIWNYIHSGSFMPTNVLLNQLLSLSPNPDVFDLYLSERVGLQLSNTKELITLDYLLFPFRFVYLHYYLFAIPFSLGILLVVKHKCMRLLYSYIVLTMLIYMVTFKSSISLGVNARFHFITFPFIVIAIVCLMSKWNIFGLIQSSLNISILSYIIIFISIFIYLDNSWFIPPQSKVRMQRKIQNQIRNKINYALGYRDMNFYLGFKNVEKVKFLNANLTRQDKVLYFFHAQGIYTEPILYQNTKSGMSILYTSGDQKVIMNKLREKGIEYLSVDMKWAITSNSPFGIMLADITIPIFEPRFFSKHFIPLENLVPDLYVFKINYNGITNENEIINNISKIKKTGFYDVIYRSIKRNIRNEKLIRIDLNPYKAETLLNEYEAFYSGKAIVTYRTESNN